MELTKEQIEEYRKIHKKLYGNKISCEEAMKSGLALVNFIRLINKHLN